MTFTTPIDICNRALQLCGAQRIDATLGFNEDSKNASECQFVYDKLRRAELRRNVWRFATRHAIIRPLNPTFVLLAPKLWSTTTQYFLGSIVSDTIGTVWIAQQGNLNAVPGTGSTWQIYYGPTAISPWDTSMSYYAGDVAYIMAGNGTATAYLSLESSNTENPTTPDLWLVTTQYRAGDVVVDTNNTPYQSNLSFNIGNTPSASTAPWVAGTSYASGVQVQGTNGQIYSSAISGNIGNNPVNGGNVWSATGVYAPWTTLVTRSTGSTAWQQLITGFQDLVFTYPEGAGPSFQTETRNVFMLPANFLRMAPQDPKAGSTSYLGAPAGLAYTDWLIEGNYIVSATSTPIILRFIADVQDVTQFDDMFCEGLANRIAVEIVETLTQSTGKKQAIASNYAKFMTEARIVNGIETGPTEPPEDDYVTCRW